MGPLPFFSVLAFLAFLFAVNIYLRGNWTKIIELILFAVLYGWALSAFYFLNWVWGLVALVAPFFMVAAFVPAGRAIARRLVSGPLRQPWD